MSRSEAKGSVIGSLYASSNAQGYIIDLYHFFFSGSRWKVKDLTYKISKYPKAVEKLGREKIDNEIHEAFQVWENATDLTFTRKSSGKVHIEIRFESREHGDGDPFDGEGGTLAHVSFTELFFRDKLPKWDWIVWNKYSVTKQAKSLHKNLLNVMN